MSKLSVIVVSYNSENTIEKTLDSIINQTYNNFELILLDRNSKDKTLEIAGKYKNNIDKWISEPDKFYETLNKGVLLAQGDYILFLNSGDILFSERTLEIFSQYLKNEDIIYSNINLSKKKYNPKYNKKYALIEGETFLASEFIKRNLLEKTGGFDTRFRILSDKEFNLRAILKEKSTIKYVNEVSVTITKNKDEILSPKKARRLQKEKNALRKIYFNKIENIVNEIIYFFLKNK